MKHRLVLLTALGLLAIAAALPAAASAAGQTYKTSTSLVVKPTKAEGKLSSTKAACLENRSIDVALFLIGSPPGQPVTIKTDAGGRWSVKIEVPDGARGQVSVRVSAKSLAGGVCGATQERAPL